MLQRRMHEPVTVTVRRAGGRIGTVTGRLAGFDRHFNVLLVDARERYSAVETVLVSQRERNPRVLLTRFLAEYPSKATTPEQILGSFASPADMWASLYAQAGVLDVVASLLHGNCDKARAVLARRAGHHRALIAQLQARAAGREAPQADVTADYVCLASDAYPGRRYFVDNRTQRAQWEAPAGVVFRPVKLVKHRERAVGTVLLSGDVVACVQTASQNRVTAPLPFLPKT